MMMMTLTIIVKTNCSSFVFCVVGIIFSKRIHIQSRNTHPPKRVKRLCRSHRRNQTKQKKTKRQKVWSLSSTKKKHTLTFTFFRMYNV